MTASKTTKGRTSNRFTKGTAKFDCQCCGRGTRDTGRGDNELVKVCAECYDLGGYENRLSDEGKLTPAECAEANSLLVTLSGFVGQRAYELHDAVFKEITRAGNTGVNPEKVSKTELHEIATALPKRLQEAAKPSATKKVKVDLKARAKAVKKVPAPKKAKEAKKPDEPKFTDWMIWANSAVVDVVFGKDPLTKEEAQKHFSMKYTVPITATTMEDGRKHNDYLKTLQKGKVKTAKTPKAASEKAPRAPRAVVADDTLYHVAPVAEGKAPRRGQTAINMAVLEKLKTFTRAQALEALTPSVGLPEAKSVWADGKNRSIIVVAPAPKAKKAKK